MAVPQLNCLSRLDLEFNLLSILDNMQPNIFIRVPFGSCNTHQIRLLASCVFNFYHSISNSNTHFCQRDVTWIIYHFLDIKAKIKLKDKKLSPRNWALHFCTSLWNWENFTVLTIIDTLPLGVYVAVTYITVGSIRYRDEYIFRRNISLTWQRVDWNVKPGGILARPHLWLGHWLGIGKPISLDWSEACISVAAHSLRLPTGMMVQYHINGKVVRVTALVVTGDVEACLQRSQRRPGQSFWPTTFPFQW